jgi:ABC-type uncharacterized transport system involved in gliding motility auxiliary subunit
MSENKAHPIKQISGGLIGLLALLAALVAANTIINNLRLRADLTDENRYSLSEGTINTMAKLEKSVELQFYFSRSNPKVPMQLKTFANQTEDLLKEYQRAGKGKIKLTVIDPKPDTDAEDQAAVYNLRGVPLEMYGAPMYMGLVVICGKLHATIPVIDPQRDRFLEYDISRMIYQVTHPDKPRVGLISSLPVMGSAAQPFMMPGQPQPPNQPAWFAFSDLQRDFDLQEINAAEAENGIPADIQTLIVVHPKTPSDKFLYAIDQFVLRGGHLIAFVDPVAYSDNAAPAQPYGMRGPQVSTLGKLFDTWGIGYDQGRVVVDRTTGMQVREGNRVVMNHGILIYDADRINNDDSATANLTSLQIVFGGSLKDNTDDDVMATPLISTSGDSGSVPSMTAQFGVQAMNRDYKPAGSPQNIALKLTGTFKTAFPNGKPADTEDEEKPESKSMNTESLKEGESTIVVIADVDMLADITNVEDVRSPFGTIRQQISNNGVLLANLIDQLAGDQDLINIRGRTEIDRSFTRVTDLRQKAQLQFEDKISQLQEQLQEAEQRISELQQQKDESQKHFLSPQQRQEIANFNARKRDINREMRQVQKNLRRDIDTLGAWLKFINIFLMPIIVVTFGIGVAVKRARR